MMMRSALLAMAASVAWALPSTGVAAACPPPHAAPAHSRGDAGVVETVVAVFDDVSAADRPALLAAAQNDGYWSLRHEPGTISYHVVPDPQDPARFVFVGTFTNAAAYAAHRTSPAAQAFFALAAKDHVTGPELVIAGTSVPNVPS